MPTPEKPDAPQSVRFVVGSLTSPEQVVSALARGVGGGRVPSSHMIGAAHEDANERHSITSATDVTLGALTMVETLTPGDRGMAAADYGRDFKRFFNLFAGSSASEVNPRAV